MVRNDGRGTDGTCCWKTKNGDGPKLTGKYGNKVNVLWDNCASVKAWFKDAKTITTLHGNSEYNFKFVSSPIVS